MSNHLITAAYKADLATPMRKSVMVLLADKASDDGSGIWASKQTMADELCCSKQAVITTIKAFLAEGLLAVEGQRKSPTGYTNCYAINVEKLKSLALVKCWADKEKGSTSFTGQPPLPVNEDYGRGQPPLPKPSRTPQVDKANALPTKRATVLPKPDGVEQSIWNDFLELRKAKRAPITNTALAAIEREADKAGWPLNDALAECAARGWQGFKADWVKEATNGKTTSTGYSDRRSSLARAIDEGLGFLG